MKYLIILLVVLLCPITSTAETVIADNFDDTADWSRTGTYQSTSDITSESVGDWGFTSQVANPVTLNSANGHTGKGIRFEVQNSGGTTQEITIGGYPTWVTSDPITEQWHGYWWKISNITDWGTGGPVKLKQGRFYMGESIIPTWNGIAGSPGHLQMNFGWSTFQEGATLTDIYRCPDTDWHKYVWQYKAETSPSANDGIIRLWVDDVLEYENTAVDWNPPGGSGLETPTEFQYDGSNWFYMQGNISGHYDGGEKFIYWDDFIIATTQAEVFGFLGESPAVSNQTPIRAGTQTITTGTTPIVTQ